ncbi:MAG: Hint domain-containing protein [Rhodobacteraceae bacterium]|nr:Hint domain-containing protein [Paracoccaceae bacterium]
MADFKIDWSASNVDGANSQTTGAGTVNYTVTTDDGGIGEFQVNGPNAAVNNGSLESYTPTSATVSVVFDQTVENVTFEVYDLDQGPVGSFNYDDQITIIALDSFGNQVSISYSDLTHHTTSGTFNETIEGNATDADPTSAITVTIPAGIVSLSITFSDGSSQNNTGYIGIGDIDFDLFCFVRGTMIETSRGEIAVENLTGGDMVRTLDNGMQPIRWIGTKTVAAKGDFAPVLLRKGAVGNIRDLLVSPAHRVMVQGWKTELLFGNAEMLTSAKSMVNGDTIIRKESDEVEYFHILFDQHEIIFSEGAMTESFHPGQVSTDVMSSEARAEILTLFPELESNLASYGPAARSVLAPHEVAILNA